MTHDQRDRWALPSLLPGAIAAAIAAPAEHHPAACDLPSWAVAELVYDVDGVVLLEVRATRPGRNPVPILSALADQLVEHGWTQQAGGGMPCSRPDGVTCSGAWATWVRREVFYG